MAVTCVSCTLRTLSIETPMAAESSVALEGELSVRVWLSAAAGSAHGMLATTITLPAVTLSCI